jgi:hypothetical protein
MLRVGYDNNAVGNDTGTNWGNMRSLIVFFNDAADDYPYLPDGALITQARLRLLLADKTGANGAQIMARLDGTFAQHAGAPPLGDIFVFTSRGWIAVGPRW